MNVLLAFGGLQRPGGITPDVRNLEHGLSDLGVAVWTAGSLSDVRVRLRSEDDVDVVHVFGCLPSTTIFGSMVAARAARRRVVWTPVFHPNRLGYWRGTGLHRAMAAFDRIAVRAARLTDAIVAATPAEAAYFLSVGASIADVNPPVVGATPGALSGEERRNARARLGVGDRPVVLVVAAHSAHRKGLDVAAAALRAVRERSDVTLLLVGGGDPGPLRDEAGVVITGWLSDEDLDSAYGCADLLLVPSRYEQFSRATLEAWAHGLPVVLSDGVALAAVADGVAGLVVPFGDAVATATAIARLLADHVIAGDMGRAGHRLAADRYDLQSHARRMVQLYERVLDGAQVGATGPQPGLVEPR